MAAADGRITAAETKRLYEVVQGELVPMEPATDTYGTDQAWITEFKFDVLAEQGADAQGEFDSFIAYISQHRKELTPELRSTILHMAEAVAKAFHGVHRKERALLNALREELTTEPGDQRLTP